MRVTVVYSPAPRDVREWFVDLPVDGTLIMALRASAIAREFPDVDWHAARIGVWSRKASMDQVLREGDRVEVYRPLRVDPKVARRERFRKQGARAAGLFARKK